MSEAHAEKFAEPGVTPELVAGHGISAEEYYAKMARDIPMKRVGEAAEAANAIVFFASDAASYITGSSLNLDGGISGVL